MSGGDAFAIRARIYGTPADRPPLCLAVVAKALDRLAMIAAARFEQSLLRADLPPEALAGAVDAWYAAAGAWRAETLEQVRAWLAAE